MLPYTLVGVVGDAVGIVTVEAVVDAKIQSARVFSTDSVTKERSDVPADESWHLAVMDCGEIVDCDVISSMDQAS